MIGHLDCSTRPLPRPIPIGFNSRRCSVSRLQGYELDVAESAHSHLLRMNSVLLRPIVLSTPPR